MHRILMEEDYKPVAQPQRSLKSNHEISGKKEGSQAIRGLNNISYF